MDDFEVFTDYKGRAIRLTNERWDHILEHPEMIEQRERLMETLSAPALVISTTKDDAIHTYHRFYEVTPVTSKYLIVAVKIMEDDAFVVTAFYSSRQKKGKIIWQPQ
jgi:hypothetical protein